MSILKGTSAPPSLFPILRWVAYINLMLFTSVTPGLNFLGSKTPWCRKFSYTFTTEPGSYTHSLVEEIFKLGQG